MSTHSLYQRRLEQRVREMEPLRFVRMESIFPFDAMEDAAGPVVHRAVPDMVSGRSAAEGDLFCGRDRYLWLRKAVQIPKSEPGLRPVGRFDFGNTSGGNNSGFESLLYIDREPWQGVDANHREVFFDGLEGRTAELTFLLWSGLEGGGPHRAQEHCLRCAETGWLDEAADELYYQLRAVSETLALLPEAGAEWEALLAAAGAALLELDWDAGQFCGTVPAALRVLKSRLAALPVQKDVAVNCVGHTHIDVAWLWRLRHTREKAARSFAGALKLMEEFPEYRLFQSQPQLYQYMKEDFPGLYARIGEKVREGRWEPDGGMWLESDCNLPSGESLVRQFLHGIRFFREAFGAGPSCLWLPDAFGYSWALPQIMRQCGIKTFFTAKISWNQYNTMPDDLFIWRGADGSEVLAYLIETPDETQTMDARFATYNGIISARSVLGVWRKFKNKELSGEALLPFGYGDGGGGPNREMLCMRRALGNIPCLPRIEMSGVREFGERMWERVSTAGCEVPVWDGELYLEYHRGTYTSQAANKRWNRMLEGELMEAEMLSVLAYAAGTPYLCRALKEGWEIVLRNQFHDILPGSAIREVYEDSLREYRRAAALLERVRTDSFSALAAPSEDTLAVFSPSSFARDDLAFLPAAGGVRFERNGLPLQAQRCAGGYLVYAPLEALELAAIRVLPGEGPEEEIPFSTDPGAGTVETPAYLVCWEGGRLTRLYDRENRREVLAGDGNRLELYEDKPLDWDNWDIDRFYREKAEKLTADGPPELAECGPLRLVLRFRYRFRHSTLEQDMVFYAHNRRIDFVTRADWREDHRLLRVCFDTAMRTTKATYGIQHGHIERPAHVNTSWDAAKFEVVGHRWGDVSESNYGVSLLSDCKYGYSALGGTIGLSLLKSGKYPDPQADMGRHAFTYSLLPHTGGAACPETLSEAASLNLPVRIFKGFPKAELRLIRMPEPVLEVDAVKLAEDGESIVVRLHECRGGSHRVRLSTDLPVRQIRRCGILEDLLEEVFSPQNWETKWKPFELQTFRLYL